MKTFLIIFTFACSLMQGQVPGYPIGRCVRVLGVTAPEDAKKIGFEYLELALQDLLPLSDDEFAKTVTRIKAVGLPAISGYGFMPADVMIVGPSVDWAKVDAALRHGLDRAQRLGLSMVVYGNLLNKARKAPDGFAPAEAQKQLVEFGKRAAREGKQRGITVLIEPMPASSTNTINSVAEGLALVEEVNSPNFQMLVDFGHVMTGKEDLAILRKAAKHIKQVEIQNPNGRVYPKLASEADYASFFRALKDGGYRGGFSIHGAPKDVFVDAPVAIAMLRKEIEKANGMQVTKPSDLSIVLTRSFDASRQKVFDAMTKQEQVPRWFQPARMSLVSYEAEFRAGGTSRYIFQRPNGARMEMHHIYREIDPPNRWVHNEAYDFSPLKLLVTTVLEEVHGKTVFTQTILYPSQKERDADFDGVADSAAEAYAKLERYLESSK